MFKLIAVTMLAIIAIANGKPLVTPVAYSAPLVAAAPVVTATSSQYFARNYNGYAAAPIVAAAYTAPVAAAYTAYASPYAYSAYTAPAYTAAYTIL